MDFHWKLLRDYTCLHCCRVVLVCIVHCDFFRLMMFLVQSRSMHGKRKSEDFAGCPCFWPVLLPGCAYIFLFLTPNTRTDRIYLKHWGEDTPSRRISTNWRRMDSLLRSRHSRSTPTSVMPSRAPAPRQPSAGRNSHTFSSSTTRVEISSTSTMQTTT